MLSIAAAWVPSSSLRPRQASTALKMEDKPYGEWPSPVTAKFITTSGVRLGPLAVDLRGELYWNEGRPQEGGRNVVVRRAPGAAGASERGAVDFTPADANVRTRVHEYGGGAFALGAEGKGVIYSEFKSQRLFWAKYADAPPVCLTPEAGAHGTPDGRYRYADGALDPSGRLGYVCVREDHGASGDAKPADVVNELVGVALDGTGATEVLATGRDFYAAPRVSPDGASLAYVTWDHPSMPWDATELRVAPLGAGGAGARDADTATHALIDGADGDTSVLQPAWHPATAALYYLSDASGYHNLRRLAPGVAVGPGDAVLPRDVDFGGAAPGWQFGQQGYAFLRDGRVAATMLDRATGETSLLVFDEDVAGVADVPAFVAASLRAYGRADGLPHSFGGLTPSADGTIYMLGGGPDAPAGVYAWRALAAGSGAERAAASPAEELACSSSSRIPEGYVSVPKPVEFPCPLGTAHGYYYAPTNAACASAEPAPPLLVKVHGGPTACTSAGFNPGIQFWTSRGFAVLDVDYGGSTGYGREYRRRLRGQWGIVDIDDACAGAEYLVQQGLADGARLAIDGGSAGGYTTLGALAFRDVFTAGCSLYGVADLGALAGDTHKFESRYLDGLVGPYPEKKALYDERAPINAVDRLSCPILLLQGDEDKIVPPNQAELMHKALLAKGLPCALKIYVGEQHGFRKSENIEDALNSELYFFSKVFGFECAGDDIAPFEIDNLPAAAV